MAVEIIVRSFAFKFELSFFLLFFKLKFLMKRVFAIAKTMNVFIFWLLRIFFSVARSVLYICVF